VTKELYLEHIKNLKPDVVAPIISELGSRDRKVMRSRPTWATYELDLTE
jgi:hypothetical protein